MGHRRWLCHQYVWFLQLLEVLKYFAALVGADITVHYTSGPALADKELVHQLDGADEWHEHDDFELGLLDDFIEQLESWLTVELDLIVLRIVGCTAPDLHQLAGLHCFVDSGDLVGSDLCLQGVHHLSVGSVLLT